MTQINDNGSPDYITGLKGYNIEPESSIREKPPTEKQNKILDFIYRKTGKRSLAKTSYEAWKFIEENYSEASSK